MARSLPSLSRGLVLTPVSVESDPQEALAKASRWTAIFIGRTPTNTYRMAHAAKRRPVGLMLEEREETEKKRRRR